MIDFKVYVDQICNSSCLFVTKLLFPFELSAAGAKRGVRSLPMRTVPSLRSTQAQPAEVRPGPSDDNDDDDGSDFNNSVANIEDNSCDSALVKVPIWMIVTTRQE